MAAFGGVPRESRRQKLCQTAEEVHAFCAEALKRRESLPYEIDGVVVKVNEFARQRGAWVHCACAALGHRLQIPARGEDHHPARHHGAGRAHRRSHAGGGARSGAGGGLDRGARDVAQPRRGSPQGRARRRHRDRAQGGRRHPRVLGRSLRFAPLMRWSGTCRALPELRQPCRPRRGEVAFRCISIDCPAQAQERLLHWASRGALDIDGMGEEIVNRLVESGPFVRRGGLLLRLTRLSFRCSTWGA